MSLEAFPLGTRNDNSKAAAAFSGVPSSDVSPTNLVSLDYQ